jgi:hypothetical protein
MHPVRLPVQKPEISRYSFFFAPCRPGASTTKMANLFFRDPSSPGQANYRRIEVAWPLKV